MSDTWYSKTVRSVWMLSFKIHNTTSYWFCCLICKRRQKLFTRRFQCKGVEFVLITPNNGLYFPAIDYLYREIMQISKQDGYAKMPLVVNCAHLKGLDYTAAKGLSMISSEIQAKGQRFIVLNASEKIRYVCRKSGCTMLTFCCSLDALPATILGECIGWVLTVAAPYFC